MLGSELPTKLEDSMESLYLLEIRLIRESFMDKVKFKVKSKVGRKGN